MAWILLSDGRIVEQPGVARLSDGVVTGDPGGGIVVGLGGPQGSPTEFAGSQMEINQVAASVVTKGSRLGRGDPLKFQQHFKDHRDLVQKAAGAKYPVSPAGETAFLNDLTGLIASRRLRPIGAGTLARGEPMVYVFRGMVGSTALTLIMKPNGDWQTVLRSGEGLDLRIRFLMRFDTPHPFQFP